MVMGAAGQAGQWTTYGHDPQRSGNAARRTCFFSIERCLSHGAGMEDHRTQRTRSSSMVLTAPLLVRAVVNIRAAPKNLWSSWLEPRTISSPSMPTMRRPGSGRQISRTTRRAPVMRGWLCPTGLNSTPVIDASHGRVFVISSDGKLHTLALADGRDAMPPAQFVAPYAKVWSLNYVGDVLYASLSQDCNHVKSGVAALNPDQPGRPVSSVLQRYLWRRGRSGDAAGSAVGFDGFIYGATGDAPFRSGCVTSSGTRF